MSEPTPTVLNGQVPIADDLSAPTILVDSIAGVIQANGVLTFGCTQTVLQVHSEAEMAATRRIVLRLAMPTASLPAIAALMQTQVSQMVADGLLRSEGVSASGDTIAEI
jgi:hypothetical protein